MNYDCFSRASAAYLPDCLKKDKEATARYSADPLERIKSYQLFRESMNWRRWNLVPQMDGKCAKAHITRTTWKHFTCDLYSHLFKIIIHLSNLFSCSLFAIQEGNTMITQRVSVRKGIFHHDVSQTQTAEGRENGHPAHSPSTICQHLLN